MMSNIPQFVACGLEMGNCTRQIPYDMAEHERIIMNNLLDKVTEHIEEIYKCNLYCAEDYCDKEQCQNAEDCFYGAIVKAVEKLKAEIEKVR